MKIKFCPKCKSINVEAETHWFVIMTSKPGWFCNKCGFRAAECPEKDIKIKKSKYKKAKK